MAECQCKINTELENPVYMLLDFFMHITLEILGYLFAFFIGIIISLLGGGGSTISIPVLVYLFNVEPYLATSYSLFLVAVTSIVSSSKNIRQKQILVDKIVVFAIPATLVAFIVRGYVLPEIPANVLFNGMQIATERFMLIVYALVIILSGYYSVRTRSIAKTANHSTLKSVSLSSTVGLISGLTGVSGSFLMVSAMSIVEQIPIKKAIATTLLIVSISATISFLTDLSTSLEIEWRFLLSYTTLALIGSFVAIPLKARMDNQRMKKLFGYFIISLGIAIIGVELFF